MNYEQYINSDEWKHAKRLPREYYESYIGSKEWRKKRIKALNRDGNQCRICHAAERLEVHHATYERLGKEKPNDLITLCRHHHELVTNDTRKQRYENRSYTAFDNVIVKQQPRLTEISNGSTNPEIQDYRRVTPAPSFGAISRPVERMVEGAKKGQR